ncbi:hypothetical protein BT96DRAFT_991531 [Gymnopus androsaceus JB14]|uniref:Uncharacterized protein n=1 Tax=Gymnopus androsaceus JB14 TaxID=1447944 RepID=A0A6A4HS91_9AGAR|nr:hypothetical protein BT96DRAFT_991531 [Gymnopus androsaceus JB14]
MSSSFSNSSTNPMSNGAGGDSDSSSSSQSSSASSAGVASVASGNLGVSWEIGVIVAIILIALAIIAAAIFQRRRNQRRRRLALEQFEERDVERQTASATLNDASGDESGKLTAKEKEQQGCLRESLTTCVPTLPIKKPPSLTASSIHSAATQNFMRISLVRPCER